MQFLNSVVDNSSGGTKMCANREPVHQELVVAVAEVGDGLQHVGEHGVRWLGGEYRVEKEDQQSSHVVLPAWEMYL